ncbi:MAG: hypothetical protein AAFP19_18765, partial [Bacteroidota bacterium]
SFADLKRFALLLFSMGGVFLLFYAPWMIKNIAENQRVDVPSIIRGKSVSPEIYLPQGIPLKPGIGLKGPKPSRKKAIDQLPQAQFTSQKLKKDRKKRPKAQLISIGNDPLQQSVREEIIRYLGYEKGAWLYTSVPYDATMNINIARMRYLDVGFLFLMLLPLLLLAGPGQERAPWMNAAALVLLFFWLATSYLSVHYLPESGVNLDQLVQKQNAYFQFHPGGTDSGFYQLYMAIYTGLVELSTLLLPVYELGTRLSFGGTFILLLTLLTLAYGLLRFRLSFLPKGFKLLLAFELSYILLWWIMGNGIVWYGMIIWILLPLILVYFAQNAELFLGKPLAPFSRALFGAVFGIFMLFNSILYLTNPELNNEQDHVLYKWPFVEYASDPTVDKTEVLKYFNPKFPEALQLMNQREEEKIYRVNTYLNYHITKNDSRVFNDPVLGKFDELTQVLDNPADFFEVLKANGFRYILYDLNTYAIDKTPDQSLRQKCESLLRLIGQTPKVQLMVTDNFVADPSAPLINLPGNRQEKARPGIFGTTVYMGSFALFRLAD